MTATVIHGDCIEQMRAMADASVDAVITDPPYLISFMGAKWDSADGIAGKPEVWREALRVLKPGGYIIAFSSSRTYGRMQVAIEDAGFITHPMIGWIFGQGFPKATRLKVPGTEHLRYGLQALKPALEPIYMGQKPMVGTGTQNWLAHGCGALNIDACRVGTDEVKTKDAVRSAHDSIGTFRENGGGARSSGSGANHAAGRWPANVIHDGSPEVLDAFAAFGERKSGAWDGKRNTSKTRDVFGVFESRDETPRAGDTGTAARFFYAAKASKADRAGSTHPTVKPLSLMRYLCRLVCPPGGTVLDMFCGTGTTLLAAQMEGFHAIGIEQDAAYVADARKRLGLTFELEAAD